MRIEISGKHLATGDSLQSHVEGQITEKVGKYFKSAIDAKVIFAKHGNFFTCEVIVDEGVRGASPVTGKDQSDDIYAAFGLAIDHVAKQLRRAKRKMNSRSNKVSLAEASIRAAASAT